jgi:hypothetical protein
MIPAAGADLRAQWETDGWCLLDDFLPRAAIDAAQEQLTSVFPTAEGFASDQDPERNAPFRTDSHSVTPRFPFQKGAFNDLVLHDRLIDLAEQLLGLTDLRLYQAILSAKYSEGAESDEQLLHVDYGNHTLVVPRAELGYQHLELFVYLSDVTAASGATRMVSRTLTGHVPIERTYLSMTDYADLYDAEIPAEGAAGSVLAYRPDVFHRGVRVTAPATARFMAHVSFKPGPERRRTWPGTASPTPPPYGSCPCWGFHRRAIPTGRKKRSPGWQPGIRASTSRHGGRHVSPETTRPGAIDRRRTGPDLRTSAPAQPVAELLAYTTFLMEGS